MMILDFLQTYQSGVLLAISAIICLIVTGATYLVANTWRAREEIRRRALTPVSRNHDDPLSDRRSLRHRNLAGAASILARVAAQVVPVGDASVSAIRKELNRAGFFQPSAVAWYYLVRLVLAAFLPAVFFVAQHAFSLDLNPTQSLTGLIGGAIAGLYAPGFLLSKRVKQMQQQCRNGFPDFMDLMVVCAEAGISVDQAIGRVSRELTPTYPYLGVCLHMAALELRAGRSLTEAFNTLAERMGIDEAHNLGSLLQQSEELGTSLSEALRVYSEEMRDKRMSLAEERAHALPAKMTVPLTGFVFPVILIVILLPAYVRFSQM